MDINSIFKNVGGTTNVLYEMKDLFNQLTSNYSYERIGGQGNHFYIEVSYDRNDQHIDEDMDDICKIIKKEIGFVDYEVTVEETGALILNFYF